MRHETGGISRCLRRRSGCGFEHEHGKALLPQVPCDIAAARTRSNDDGVRFPGTTAKRYRSGRSSAQLKHSPSVNHARSPSSLVLHCLDGKRYYMLDHVIKRAGRIVKSLAGSNSLFLPNGGLNCRIRGRARSECSLMIDQASRAVQLVESVGVRIDEAKGRVCPARWVAVFVGGGFGMCANGGSAGGKRPPPSDVSQGEL
jgi:hypothetical protein